MQGDAEIIELLNEVLTAELTAINQYFIHAKMCENWGYDRLAEHIRDESIDEMKHADASSSGSCSSKACRTCSGCIPVRVGETVAEQFAARPGARVRRRRAAQRRHRRSPSRSATTPPASCSRSILVSEEEHVDWLETQLETIRQIGDAELPRPAAARLGPARSVRMRALSELRRNGQTSVIVAWASRRWSSIRSQSTSPVSR